MKSQMRQMPQRSRPAALWQCMQPCSRWSRPAAQMAKGWAKRAGRSRCAVPSGCAGSSRAHSSATSQRAPRSLTQVPTTRARIVQAERREQELGSDARLPHIDPYILSVIIRSDQARCAQLLRPTHARICPTPPRLAEPHTHTPSDRALGSSLIAACLRAGEDTAATTFVTAPWRPRWSCRAEGASG